MQIAKNWVGGFKGVDASFVWARAVVLFGPNDAGKSNILEAFVSAAGGTLERQDPIVGPPDEAVTTFGVLLDTFGGDDALDSQLRARLLQTRHVPPLFLYEGAAVQHDPRHEFVMWGESSGRGQYPASRLRWSVGIDPEGKQKWKRFKLGCHGEPYSETDPVLTVGSWSTMRAALMLLALEEFAASRERVGIEVNESEVLALQDAFADLIELCLACPYLLCAPESRTVRWLAPLLGELREEQKAAARRLVDAFGDAASEIPIIGELVRAVVETPMETSTPRTFLIVDQVTFTPWEVVRVSGSTERLHELAQEVNTFVRTRLEEDFVGRVGNTVDPWLDDDADAGVSVSEAVHELCGLLSQYATRTAPPFVTRDYEIRVEPLSPGNWHQYGDRRVRLAVSRRTTGETYDLRVVGSGIAVWAGFALEQAMREVARQVRQEFDEAIAKIGSSREGEDSGLAPRLEPTVGERIRMYVLDEPERHLHPRAQSQAAEWLADLLDENTSLLIATHALPFLSLPTDDAQYVLVSRDRDHTTRAEMITEDIWGVLDQRKDEGGLGSRAQLIQVAQGFLIVEGAHDEAVIKHFFRQDLERARIVVLPARGATKAASLIEAELLAMLDVPMVILFDDIKANSVAGAVEPSKRNVAAHSVWQMLQHWPPERERPHVLDFGLPDIYCALPDACVARTISERGGSFPGWDPLVAAFEGTNRQKGFKRFFLELCGLNQQTDTEELLRSILDTCREPRSSELARAIAEAVAITSRTHRHGNPMSPQ